MAKRKVFLSSTSKDLAEFRDRILRALRKSDAFEVVAMEDFGTRDAWPKDFCLAAVRSCDIFVGILGHLYGFVPQGDTVSMTEQEYLAAAEKPRLMWVMPDDVPVLPKLLKADKHLDKQEQFRERVLNQRIVETDWSTPEQLTTSVLTALQNQALSAPAERADEAGRVHTLVSIDRARYADRCLRKWRHVDLSTLANPGALDEDVRPELSEVFIPQHARETRPITTLPRDYLESQGLPEEDEVLRDRLRQRWLAAKPRPVLDLVADTTAGQLVLLGDPGSGKSSLARYVLLQLVQPGSPVATPVRQSLGERLPLLVELRDLIGLEAKGKCADIVSYLGYLGSVEGFGFEAAALKAHLANEPTLLILDGLDEIFDVPRRKAMVEEIVGLAVRFPLARVLVTSRIAGFDAHPFEAAGFVIATVVDLTDDQVEAFATGWFPLAFPGEPDKAAAARDDLLATLRRRPQLRSIAGNPMLLTIMAVVARHKRLARSRTALYRQGLDVLCYAWDYRRGLQLAPDSPLADLQAEDTLLMLRRIAWHMQEGAEGLRANAVSTADLRGILQRFFAEEWRFPPPKASRAAQDTLQLLQERSWVLTPRGPGLFGFVHRTFLEYLCALELAERFKARELEFETLRDDFLLPHVDDDAWKEVIRLLMGLLPPAQVDGLIQAICPRKDEARKNGARLALAWQCIAEVDPKQLARTAAACEALIEALYQWIIPRDTQPGAAEIAESLRAVEPGCWPTSVLPRRGFPTHTVQWWPTYGDCFTASHYESVFPALCDTIFAHEPGAFDKLRGQLDPGVGIDPSTRLALIGVITRWFGDRPETRQALHRLATAAYVAGIPPHPECDGYREQAREAATRALGARVLADREVVFATLCTLATDAAFPEVRNAALSRLASTFGDRTENKRLFHAVIRADAMSTVRETAVRNLALLAHEPDELFSALRQLVADDRSADVRQAALTALAASFPAREEALEILRFRTAKDESADVRGTAIEALARADPGESPARVRERSVADVDEHVRAAALRQLSLQSSGSEDAFALICERLQVEESSYVRLTAVQILASAFERSEDARHLIQERARLDDSPDVRAEALYQWGQRVLDPPDAAVLRLKRDAGRPLDPRTPVSEEHLASLSRTFPVLKGRDVRGAFERMVDEHAMPLTLEWRGARPGAE